MSVKFFKLSYLLPAVAMAGLAFAPACGGDDDDPADIDAPEAPDAGEDIDAADTDAPADAMPEPTRAGTIALTELAQSQDTTIGGSNVTIEFTDLATATAPAFGTSPINGCVVYTYDLAGGEAPPTVVADGDVTVAGTAHAGFDCPAVTSSMTGEFLGYLCAEDLGTAGMGTTATDDGLVGAGESVNYTIEGADLNDTNPVGAAAQFIGFDMAHAAAAAPGLVTAVTLPNQVTTQNRNAFDSGAADADPAVMAADGLYGFVVGVGPAFPGYAEIFNFLDDGTSEVTISKAASEVGAIEVTLHAAGEGFALNATSAQPHNLTTDGSAVTFSCAGTEGGADTCGVRAAEGEIDVLVVSGTADNAAADADPTALATFRCAYLSTPSAPVTDAEIPADAMAAIMSISPTTVTTTVFHAAGTIATDDAGNSTNVLVGHGVVGRTVVDSGGGARLPQPAPTATALRELAAQR